MNELRVLIVEDDKDILGTYEKQIKRLNEDNSKFTFKATYAESEESAIHHLSESEIDAAIIDLKLGNQDIEYKGLNLLKKIKNHLRFPVFIVTGNPEGVRDELTNQNDFFQIRTKGEQESELSVVLREVAKIYQTGITKILGRTGKIEKYLNEIFWLHLSESVNLWSSDESRTPEEKEQSLLRYTLHHIQEYLDLTEEGQLANYHPAEFYITKPVKPNIFTGDILEILKGKQKGKYIILTPACDIDIKSNVRKAEKILLLKIHDWQSIDDTFKVKPISNTAKNKLRNYLKNSIPRFHYTPKTNNIAAGFIDFQDKLTISGDLIDKNIRLKKYRRIATISSPFLKDIISRYSSYYSRQGSPDFDFDELFRTMS